MRVRMMEEYLNDAMARERLIAFLSGFFGILALGLASVGLYGVMAYAVTQRTREMGIRMALGAQRGDVVRMIVRESLVPVLIGIAHRAGRRARLGSPYRQPAVRSRPERSWFDSARRGGDAGRGSARRGHSRPPGGHVEPMTALRYE